MTAAIFLRPFASLLLMYFIVRPIKRWAWRAIPNGRVKRVLFFSWKV